ncbi:MAG: sugar transferase [Bacteroidetes bacterium]|nr:sugar transferase [Bacteroidota bacterium]
MHHIFKQLFDFSFATLLVVLSLPFQILFSIILTIELKENPFFFQKRSLAFNLKHFTIFKFRTIKKHSADKLKHQKPQDIFVLPDLSNELTPFAKWLRRNGLDELPQIYNVLLGQMSFIGPRPFMLEDLVIIKNKFAEQNTIREKIKSKPGIAGTWQIIGDRKLGMDNLIGMDLFYEENKSFLLDMKILFSSILLLVFAKNSDAILPKITPMGKLFSISHFEFITDHRKYLDGGRGKEVSYKLKMPLNWWYANDSHTIFNNSNAGTAEGERKKVPTEIFSKN